MEACRIAGLSCRGTIDEPTAAAYAYGLHQVQGQPKNVVVFHLGGGTLDISVLRAQDGAISATARRADERLGGRQIDKLLTEHCMADFKTKSAVDISGDKSAMARLRRHCSGAKHALSEAESTNFSIERLAEGKDYSKTITREELDALCEPLFQRCMPLLTQALADASLSKEQIDQVVVVGGSARMPRVQQILCKFFGLATLNMQHKPEEAAAYGAAVQAGILSRKAVQSDSGKKRLRVDLKNKLNPSADSARLDSGKAQIGANATKFAGAA